MSVKHILLVDDEVEFAKMVGFLLESRDYKVQLAHTGAQALERIKHNPDLVLLDCNLPDMDGFEVCRVIRNNPQSHAIPVIIVSGRGEAADKVQGLYTGADDYMTKPFDKEELFARIDAILRRSQFAKDTQNDNGSLVAELRKIVKARSVTPFFQPIFFLDSFKLLGMEALSRPPVDSLINNPEFLFKAALDFGMYFEVEMLCWHKAVAKWRESEREGKLFLNCSPYLIENEKFTEKILSDEFKLDPQHMVLEITERMAIKNYMIFSRQLNLFRKQGLQIAVDDAGSGFSSLDTIAELKPDIVKVDMPLIRDIHVDSLKQNILEAIIGFCKKSGITTVAEGIEKKEELDKVIELGIDAGQGYLLARPAAEIKTKYDVAI